MEDYPGCSKLRQTLGPTGSYGGVEPLFLGKVENKLSPVFDVFPIIICCVKSREGGTVKVKGELRLRLNGIAVLGISIPVELGNTSGKVSSRIALIDPP